MRIEQVVGDTRDGGSCCRCGGDYTGSPYQSGRGKRVLAEIEPGVVEPVNVCRTCYERADERREL